MSGKAAAALRALSGRIPVVPARSGRDIGEWLTGVPFAQRLAAMQVGRHLYRWIRSLLPAAKLA